MRFQTKNGVLIAQANGETLRIEPWGKDSLRVRATMLPGFSGKDWALTEVPEKTEAKAEQFAVDHLEIDGSMGKRTSASITNGKIRAVVNFAGVITFYKEDQEILREYHRCYDGTISKESRRQNHGHRAVECCAVRGRRAYEKQQSKRQTHTSGSEAAGNPGR